MIKFIQIPYLVSVIMLVTLLGATSCDIGDNKIEDEALNFHHIYDIADYDASFSAVDIVQTPDDQYIVLQEVPGGINSFKSGSVLFLDESGTLIKQADLPEGNFLTSPDLLLIDSTAYVLGTPSSTSSILYALTDSSIQEINTINTPTPFAASVVNENQILIAGVDINADVTTEVILTSADGTPIFNNPFSISLGSEQDVSIARFQKEFNEHITGTGRFLPMFVGQALDGTYFINTFSNSTLSLVFTDLNNTDTWELQGQQTLAAVTSIVNTSGANYAISRYNTTENFFASNQPLSVEFGGSPINSSSIDSLSFPEIEAYARTKAKVITVNGAEVVVFGSTTQDSRIILIAYDALEGTFLGSQYFGFSVPHELGDFIQTSDGGLALVGTAFVTGRFKRTSFFKMSAERLADWINN